MSGNSPDKHVDLTHVNPRAYDQQFVINKNVRDLETIRKTFKPNAPTVLTAVRDFLPKLAAANDDIQKRLELDPVSVCIENVEDGESHVQMDIALVEQSDEESDSSDTSESDDDVQIGEVTMDNIKLPKQHGCTKKVLIECCSDNKDRDTSERPKSDQHCVDETYNKSIT